MTTFLLPLEPITSLDAYLATGSGGVGVETAQRLGAGATITTIADSGLRGRGGGGFPTGRKWTSIASQAGTRRYVVCNGAEGEPGTFKDRALLRANPYQIVEGLIIAAFAIGADEAFICLKAGFTRELAAVTRAVPEFQAAGICTDCTVTVVAGPDEYLFGEEKAMLEVIEGKPPLPRWFPPYEHGLFAAGPQEGWEAGPPRPPQRTEGANPTLVNNVETLANVSHILARGADWFRSMGTDESPGTVVATVVGDVVAPDVGEIELGTPLGAVIDAVGSGVREGRTVKAVFSDVATSAVTALHLDVPVSYEGFQSIGSGMGLPASSSTTTSPAWSMPPTASCPSSHAASARHARSAPARSPRGSSESRPAQETTTTLAPCTVGSSGSPTVTAAISQSTNSDW